MPLCEILDIGHANTTCHGQPAEIAYLMVLPDTAPCLLPRFKDDYVLAVVGMHQGVEGQSVEIDQCCIL